MLLVMMMKEMEVKMKVKVKLMKKIQMTRKFGNINQLRKILH
jgi:hypothetical protein